jgi:hypothetical protein
MADMEPELRERLSGGLGQHGVESMLIASHPGHLLWTYDILVGDAGACEFGVRRVWTQLVAEHAASEGVISSDLYQATTAKLIAFRYKSSRFDHFAILKAGELCDWDVQRWPFNRVLEIFADETVPKDDAILIASFATKGVFDKIASPQLRQSVLIRILDQLRRDDKVGAPSSRCITPFAASSAWTCFRRMKPPRSFVHGTPRHRS